MKPLRLLSFLLAGPLLSLAASPRAAAQCTPGPHSGTIAADQTWCAADSPHVVSGVVTIASGVTLTVEAGSTVKPAAITVLGHLAAVGTAASPITFTSDGAGWESLTFSGGTGLLRYVDVLRAGWNNAGVIVANVGAPGVAFEHCNLGPGNRGMTVSNGVVSITDSKVEGLATATGAYPIVVSGADSRLSLANDTFLGNWADEVLLENGAMTGADFTLAPQPGLACYRFPGDYEVPSGRTVTLAAGTIIHEDWTFTVKGRLVSQGTAADPVTITSGRWHWGDHTWVGLVFDGGTGDLSYTSVAEADTKGVTVLNAGPAGVVLDHCTIGPSSGRGGLVVESSLVTAASTAFTGIAGGGAYPVVVRGASSRLALAAATFSGNAANRVAVETGAMTSADFTLAAHDGLDGYLLGGDYTIPPGRTVTVGEGVNIYQEGGLHVQGRLVTNGTTAAPVTITNGWRWTGVFFDGGTGQLSHTRVTNAGFNTAGITVTNVPAPGVVLDGVTLGPGNGALSITDGVVSATGSTFTGIAADYAIYVGGASSRLALSGNTFSANTRNQIHLYQGAMSGADFTLVPQNGLEAWHLGGDFAIPAGRTVTLDPGVTVYQDGGLHVLGRFVANGTSASPVTITNGWRWNGVFFDGGTGTLTWTRITNAGFNSAALTATNVPLPGVVLDHASIGPGNDGIESTDSVLAVRDSTFEVNLNGRYAIHVHGPTSTLSLSNSTFGGTGDSGRRIGLAAGAMTGGDVTLVPQQGLDGYLLGSGYTVPEGRTLTADAGTPLIATNPLVVRGRLVTRGTAARPVTIDGYRWAIDVDGGTGDLVGAVLRDGGFSYPAVAVRNGGSLLLERTRLHDCNIVRSEASTVTLRNVAFLGGYPGQVEVDAASTLTATHATFTRANGTAVVVKSGSTVSMTNSLFASCPLGVHADATSSATLRNTLWDAVPTQASGNVSQNGILVGSAAFEADGYHVGAASAALAQGVITAVADDLDGEARPRPAGLLPDLGADEASGGALIPGRSATPIAVGETKSGTALAGAFADFVATLAAGRVPNLIVRVEAASGTGTFRLLVRNRQFPLATLFDVEGRVGDETTREVLVPAPLPGDWYLSVLSTAGEVPFTISVSGAERGVSSVSPSSGGNAGSVVAEVLGAGFEPGSRIELRAAGVPLRSFVPISATPTQLSARFDLVGLPALACDVAVVWPDAEEHVLPGAFHILEGGRGTLVTDLVLPGAVRAGRPATLVLVYGNSGTVDMPAPLLEIRSVQNIPMRLGEPYAFQRRPFRILGIGGGAGTAGTLSAGKQGVVAFHVIPEGAAHAALDFQVRVLEGGASEPIGWAALETELRSPAIDDEAWARLWALFRADVGSTWEDWADSLRESADALSANTRFVHDPALLVGSRFVHLAGYGIPTNLSIALDASAPAPGPPLALLRSYPNTLLSRMRLGPFGRGWRNALWDTVLSVSSSGEVLLRGGSNELRRFIPVSNGAFLGSPDDSGRLSTAGGLFTLTEADLRVLSFRADGHLASVTDRFGNRADLDYDGAGRLVLVRHSSGDQLTLQWNGNGRIVRLIDHAGRVTTYDYDASGSLLTTVTAPGGRTWHYAYQAMTGGPADYALTSITLPDGTHRHFEYDAAGRLARRSVDGGLEPLSFGYEVPARMTSTDGAGNTFRTAFDEAGRVTGTSDPSGAWGWLLHDPAGNVAHVVGPDGAEATITHGAFGELKSVVDTLGEEASLRRSYTTGGGVFLRGLVDPKGNASAFDLGPRFELSAVAFPDGSRWEATSDSTGEVTTFRNRRGEQVVYTRNSRGQVVRKDLPGGINVTYDYDTVGRLLHVTGPEGTFVLDHDSRGFLTRLSNPDGTWIAWELDDAGKRTRRTTSDGASLSYGWDAAGRLASIHDGEGTLLGRYSYDAAGRLLREERGNGTSTTTSYDPSGRPSTILHRGPDGAVQESLGYEWDVNGNPTRMTGLSGVTSWTWDDLGRLTHTEEPTGRTTDFSYDAAGNRTGVTVNGVPSGYSSNVLNQVTAAGSDSFTYDADGNLLTRTDSSGTTRYDWDVEGRLTRVTHPTGGVFEYRYDSLGRLAEETRGASSSRFSWDGGLVESERDGTGALVARYAAGYGLLSRTPAAGAPAYFAYDLAGSTLLLTDGSGAIANRYEYGPFGEPRSVVESLPNPYRFSGAWGVRTESHGLLRMGSRPYDPGLGRFVAADPISYASGYNLYAYCGNAPVYRVDPSGLEDIGGDKKNLLYSLIGLLETKAIGTISGLVTAPEGMTASLKEMIAGYKAGDMKAVSHGAGSFAWTLGSSVGGAAIASIESGTVLMWGAEGAAVTVGGVALAPVLAVAGVVIVASDIATDLYLEDIQQKRTFLERGPAARNAYATWPDQIRPDGTLPPELLELWRQHHGMDVVQPGDPNEKLATPGAGPRHLVRAGEQLSYVVHFENVPTASAPAQEVFVDDVLDPSLDLSTLELVSIGWGDHVVDIAADDLPVSRRETVPDYRPTDGRRWFVDVSADLVGTRLRITLRTIDPTTDDLPEDALAGFLPPNDATGRGQGVLELSIRTKTGLSPGTRIANTAAIIFDTQAPITTAEVFNTIGLPGDVNDDGVVNPADVFYLVSFFYSAGPAPLGIADVNFDGRVDALDLFYLINFLYAGGPAPL